jgi:hypothetical protein
MCTSQYNICVRARLPWPTVKPIVWYPPYAALQRADLTRRGVCDYGQLLKLQMNPAVVEIIISDLIKICIFACCTFLPLVRELEIEQPLDVIFWYNTGGTRILPDPPIPRSARQQNHNFSSSLFALPLSPHCNNQQQWYQNQQTFVASKV